MIQELRSWDGTSARIRCDSDIPLPPPPLTVEELCRESYAIAASKGWHDTPGDFYARCMLVVTELAEMVEEKRNGRGCQETYYPEVGGPDPSTKPLGIPSEAADVFIRMADLCAEFEIPVAEAIREKMEYNRSRSYRHGGKEA